MATNASVYVAVADDEEGRLYVVVAVNEELIVLTPDKAREMALLIAKTAKEIDDVEV